VGEWPDPVEFWHFVCLRRWLNCFRHFLYFSRVQLIVSVPSLETFSSSQSSGVYSCCVHRLGGGDSATILISCLFCAQFGPVLWGV
jgi:hypothetical protein